MNQASSKMLQNSPWTELLGEWEMTSPIFNGAPGRAVFEWVEDGAYLALRSTPPPVAPVSIWLIGGDDSAGAYTALYTDERGISRIYQAQLTQDAWTMWRDDKANSQRFESKVDFKAGVIKGVWFSLEPGGAWKPSFDLVYTRRQV
jgi:hypothetical protein